MTEPTESVRDALVIGGGAVGLAGIGLEATPHPMGTGSSIESDEMGRPSVPGAQTNADLVMSDAAAVVEARETNVAHEEALR